MREDATDIPHVTTGDIDLDVAFRCVELSKLAYADPTEAAAQALGRFSYDRFDHLTRGDRHHAIAVADRSQLTVAFRGTWRSRDWIVNLKAWTRKSRYGRIHKGYFDACEALLPDLRKLFAGLPQQLPIYLTGHSMGGAMAVLAATALCDEIPSLSGIYTFGQPQVGGKDFRAYFEQRVQVPFFRFVNGADAIAAWSYGKHASLGRRCYFDIRGRLVFGDRISEIPRLRFTFHRLDHYRYFLNLNRQRYRAMVRDDDATVLLDDGRP